MGRIGTAFKTDMLKEANGKVRFLEEYFVIPRGKISCVSCNQSYPVEDLVTKRLECPQCHTTSKLLIDGKEPDFFRSLGQKKIETEKEIRYDDGKKVTEKEIGILGINFWYETKDELINSQDAKTYLEIKGKSVEEYPEGIKFVPNAHIIGMYNHIISGDEKISDFEAKVVHEEMTKRKLWERVKKTDDKKLELKPKIEDEKKIVLDETEKAKVLKTTEKEIKTEKVLDKIRERLKSEKTDEPKTEEEKKISETSQMIKEEIKKVEEKEIKTEKELKALKSVNRLRTKYGNDLEDKIAMVIVRIENRGLKLFTGNEEELSGDEQDDLSFAWSLIFDKYGVENIIGFLPELAIISMHIEIFGGHAYAKYQKGKEKKQKKIEERKHKK